MPDSLPVHVNRQERHSLEVPPSFETDDSFVIGVQNHGEASRVHVHLDGDLADIATIEETNHYVRANELAEIPVAIQGTGPVTGKLKVVSGYGAKTRWIDVRITEPDDSTGVEIDEDLATPQPDDESTESATLLEALTDRPAIPVLGLGVLAVLIAAGAALVFRNAVVAAGAVAVLLAVAAALALVFR